MPALRSSTRRLRQLLTVMRHPREQLAVRRTFARAQRRGLAVPRGAGRFKYVGDYLARSLTRQERCAALIHHYDFLLTLPVAIDAGDVAALWRASDDEGRSHEVLIQPATLAPMEGEHELCFRLDGKRLYTLTFSVVSGKLVGEERGPALLIGGMQGAYWAREELRYAARKNGEIAPPTMLLLAASVLAGVLRLPVVAGPSNAIQAARGYVVDGRSSTLDYDELWTQAGGHRNARDFFVLPPGGDDDADAPVTGKHRSRTRRRRQLRAALRDDMQRRLAAAMAGADADRGEPRAD